MPTGSIGYDPIRIHDLTRRLHLALDHLLRAPTVSDPLAEPARATLRLVRAHLEHEWLPQLTRITASTAMTGFSSARLPPPTAPGTALVAGGESGPPASNSLDSEVNPSAAAVDVGRRATSTQTVLGDGWTFGCGPVSATTGQQASGCEWMPPERWDLSVPLLVASVLPGTGEVIDAVDCVRGDIPCEVAIVPFVSGRGVGAFDDLVAGARAADVARPLTLGSEHSWRLQDTLDEHFDDHGPDFGSTSAEHYARQASEFLARGVTANLPTKIDPRNGQIRIYEESTNTFGAYNPDGTTATFFKPDPAEHGFPTNMEYWMDQPG